MPQQMPEQHDTGSKALPQRKLSPTNQSMKSETYVGHPSKSSHKRGCPSLPHSSNAETPANGLDCAPSTPRISSRPTGPSVRSPPYSRCVLTLPAPVQRPFTPAQSGLCRLMASSLSYPALIPSREPFVASSAEPNRRRHYTLALSRPFNTFFRRAVSAFRAGPLSSRVTVLAQTCSSVWTCATTSPRVSSTVPRIFFPSAAWSVGRVTSRRIRVSSRLRSLVRGLRRAGVRLGVDVRHALTSSPCAAPSSPRRVGSSAPPNLVPSVRVILLLRRVRPLLACQHLLAPSSPPHAHA
ncbi:hypothetical protein C8J57DRAFT_1561783 [Mycena rebaudengoi]|nr:hypothetical protein C8J57DRAFT_1561783 [Mycena rebaudengoi]